MENTLSAQSDDFVILTDRGNWVRTVKKHPDRDTVQTITSSSEPIQKSTRTFHKDGTITRTISYINGKDKTEILSSHS
jgi:hypothetical protein